MEILNKFEVIGNKKDTNLTAIGKRGNGNDWKILQCYSMTQRAYALWIPHTHTRLHTKVRDPNILVGPDKIRRSEG